MEENLVPQVKNDFNWDFELVPGELLEREIYFLHGHHIENTELLYRLCVNLALRKEPFGTTTTVHFDYLQAKVTKNQFFKDVYGGFEPIAFHEIRKFNPVRVSGEKALKNIIAQFKKKPQTRKGLKPKRKFIPPDVKNIVVSEGDKERPLNEKEQKEEIERERKIFEEADSLSSYDYGMYDVYHGYSNIELRTKEDYNFLRDGYEFEDFRLCFAFKLRQIEKHNIRSFFKYQLKVNFQSDKEQFKDFVKDIMDGYNEPNFFPTYIIKPVNDFLGETYLSEIKSNEVAKENENEDSIKQKDTAIRTKATKYLLQSLNCNVKIDDQIKFVRYLLGKDETKKVEGTNEDKAFQNNETKKTKDGKIKDLEKVIELFTALKLNEPLNLAQIDLNRLKK